MIDIISDKYWELSPPLSSPAAKNVSSSEE